MACIARREYEGETKLHISMGKPESQCSADHRQSSQAHRVAGPNPFRGRRLDRFRLPSNCNLLFVDVYSIGLAEGRKYRLERAWWLAALAVLLL